MADVLKLPVNTGKPDIGNLVNFGQFHHDKFAYDLRGNFLFVLFSEHLIQLFYDLILLGKGNRPFAAGFVDARLDLGPVIGFPAMILFDNKLRNEVQVVITVLSIEDYDPDVLGVIAASKCVGFNK